MRANDMAHGGQGAPLVPAYHAALAAGLDPSLHRGKPVCFVNIGGISNVTYVRQGHPPIAFDTGPGNALIDQWVERHAGIPFDDGGRIAAEGGIHAEIVDAYLADPFFRKAPPKSLDRNDFDLDLVDGLELSTARGRWRASQRRSRSWPPQITFPKNRAFGSSAAAGARTPPS